MARTPGKRVTANRQQPGRETILEVGAEGGSLSIVRTRAPGGTWRFDVLRDETTLADMLDEDEREAFAITDASGAIDSLAAAFEVMERYPWHRLTPLKVHDEYQGTVLAEVMRRGGAGEAARWQAEFAKAPRRTLRP